MALLVLLFYGALGRAWTAFLAGGGIALGFSLGNYYKLQFRDDPLYFEDMLILREAKAMASGDRYSLFFPVRTVRRHWGQSGSGSALRKKNRSRSFLTPSTP